MSQEKTGDRHGTRAGLAASCVLLGATGGGESLLAVFKIEEALI